MWKDFEQKIQRRAHRINTRAHERKKAFVAAQRKNLSTYQGALEAGHNPYERIGNDASSFFLMLKYDFDDGLRHILSETNCQRFPPRIPAFGALDRQLEQPEIGPLEMFSHDPSIVISTSAAIADGKRLLWLVKQGQEYPGLCPVYTLFLYHSWKALQVMVQYWDETKQPWRQCLSSTYIARIVFEAKPRRFPSMCCGNAHQLFHRKWPQSLNFVLMKAKGGLSWTLLEMELRRPKTDVRFVAFVCENDEKKTATSMSGSGHALHAYAPLIRLKDEVFRQFGATGAFALQQGLQNFDSSVATSIFPPVLVELILQYLIAPLELADPRFHAQGWFGINPMRIAEWQQVIDLAPHLLAITDE